MLPKNIKYLLLFLLCFSMSLTVASAAHFSLDQAKVRLVIPPGGSQTGTIRIDNISGDNLDIRVYWEDWAYAQGNDGSKDFLASNSTSYSAAKFVTFSPAEFVIPPFGRQIVNYVVRLPDNAQGGYYGVLFFESTLGKYASSAGIDSAERQAGIDVALRMASLFYIETKGKNERKADINNLVLSGNKDGSPLLIQADFLNSGDVDLTVGGSFNIMDNKGMVYARGKFNDAYTLPKDKAVLNAEWKDKIPQGAYSLIATFNIGKAQEEAGLERGPVIVKEAKIQIGPAGEVVSVRPLD